MLAYIMKEFPMRPGRMMSSMRKEKMWLIEEGLRRGVVEFVISVWEKCFKRMG